MAQCKFFVAGYCMRGDSCRYAHEATPGIPNLVSAAPPAPRDVAKSNTNKRVASHFLQGGLWREEQVFTPPGSYAQDFSSPSIPQSTQPFAQGQAAFRSREPGLAKLTSDSRSQIPCYHYARGDCRNGNTCPYSHFERGDRSEQKVEAASDPEVRLLQIMLPLTTYIIVLIYPRRTESAMTSNEKYVVHWPDLNSGLKWLESRFLLTSLPLELRGYQWIALRNTSSPFCPT